MRHKNQKYCQRYQQYQNVLIRITKKLGLKPRPCFFANCKAKKPGKKGYPQFKKHTHSVEYKTSGWALSTDKRCLTFTDGFAAGTFKLLGSRDLHFYAPKEIKGSSNRKKAINKLGRKHLKVSRQRKDFAIKTTPKRSEI